MKNSTIATMAAMVFLAPLMISTPSYSAKVSNPKAASLLSQCFLEEDARDSKVPGTVGCCSFTLGYCIECPPEGESGKCEKISIRRTPNDHFRTGAPESQKMTPLERTTKPSNRISNKRLKMFKNKPAVN